MESVDGEFLSVLMTLLFGALLFLRIRFPNPPKRWETLALVIAVGLFFAIGGALLPKQTDQTGSSVPLNR